MKAQLALATAQARKMMRNCLSCRRLDDTVDASWFWGSDDSVKLFQVGEVGPVRPRSFECHTKNPALSECGVTGAQAAGVAEHF